MLSFRVEPSTESFILPIVLISYSSKVEFEELSVINLSQLVNFNNSSCCVCEALFFLTTIAEIKLYRRCYVMN